MLKILLLLYFASRLKQAILVTKSGFDKKLTSFNRNITSNKTKYLVVQNSLVTKYYNFFLGTIYFASNDGYQNTFVYQPTLHTLELKKGKGIDFVLRWKSNGLDNSKHKPLYTTFVHGIKISRYKMGIKFDKDSLAIEQKKLLEQNLKYLHFLW